MSEPVKIVVVLDEDGIAYVISAGVPVDVVIVGLSGADQTDDAEIRNIAWAGEMRRAFLTLDRAEVDGPMVEAIFNEADTLGDVAADVPVADREA